MRRMSFSGSCLSTSSAPERGGSSSRRSKPWRIHGVPRWSWVRSAAKNCALPRPLRCALARARATRPASPSTPTTSRTRRASGRVKLPSPQNRSSTRCSGCRSSISSVRAIMMSLSRALTWMKSSGSNASSTSHCGSRNDSAGASPSSGCTLSGPLGCRKIAKPCSRPKAASAARSASPSGTRWRTVSAIAASPAMNSICGICSRACRPSTSAASAWIFIPISGMTVWHSRSSATKRGSCSRKPTRVLSFLLTRRTEKRPLRR